LMKQNEGAARDTLAPDESLIFAAPESVRGLRTAVVLTAYTAGQAQAGLPKDFAALAAHSRTALAVNPSPLIQSLLAMTDSARAPADTNAALARSSAAHPTVDRALTLLWLHKAMGGAMGAHDAAATAPALQDKGWKRATTPTGASIWQWTGEALPAALDAGAARPELSALVSYRSREEQAGRLPVTIERALYRLDPAPSADEDGNFAARRVKAGEAVDGNALYLDEVVLTPAGRSAMRYGLLEVPLPPGASVEATSWGIRISGLPGEKKDSEPQPFARAASWETGELGYHQPIPLLDGRVVLRQLVRFALPGAFVMPPVRYFRMYQPEQKAYEGGRSDHATTWSIR